MTFYTDLYNGGNRSGVHYFPGTALETIKTAFGLEEVSVRSSEDGPVISLRNATTRAAVLDELTIGRSDKYPAGILVISVDKIKDLPDNIQEALRAVEIKPG